MAMLAVLSQAQTYPPAWKSSSTYAQGDQVQVNGNIYRALGAVSQSGPSPATSYAKWELYYVRSNTTLMVGVNQTFPTLVSAWNYALNAKVADGVYLHFYISSAGGNFAESFASPFLLDHGSGARMAILGDVAANDTLTFSSTNGFIVDTGHAFNTISGVSIVNSGTSQQYRDGLKADFQATVSSLSNVIFTGFGTSILATQGASVTALSSCSLSGNSPAVQASSGGSVVFPQGITLTGPGNDTIYTGFFAYDGGQIIAPGSIISSFGDGILASTGGIVDAGSSTISNCIQGIEASANGTVEAGSSTIENCHYGIYSHDSGDVDASSAQITSSFIGVYAYSHGYVNVYNGGVANSAAYDILATFAGCVGALFTSYTSSSANGSSDGSYILD
jgi:hypothetical protein